MICAFRSELLKFRRWSVLAGSGVMIAATAFIAYLTFHQITSGPTDQNSLPSFRLFQRPRDASLLWARHGH
jgi:ABC-2 type transport system permease protein